MCAYMNLKYILLYYLYLRSIFIPIVMMNDIYMHKIN